VVVVVQARAAREGAEFVEVTSRIVGAPGERRRHPSPTPAGASFTNPASGGENRQVGERGDDIVVIEPASMSGTTPCSRRWEWPSR
jgi:hypothetical protein